MNGRWHIIETLGAPLLVVSMLALASGCASREGSRESLKPGSGVAEYLQMTDAASGAIQKALESLDTVAAQSNHCSSEALASLSLQIHQLQVDSIQMRARTEAILARGDLYFAQWKQTLARVNSRTTRARLEQHRPELEHTFGEIKKRSLDTRAVFKPFLSALRTIRNSLEADASALKSKANQDLLATAKMNGRQLLQNLASIRQELGLIKDLISSNLKPREGAS